MATKIKNIGDRLLTMTYDDSLEKRISEIFTPLDKDEIEQAVEYSMSYVHWLLDRNEIEIHKPQYLIDMIRPIKNKTYFSNKEAVDVYIWNSLRND